MRRFLGGSLAAGLSYSLRLNSFTVQYIAKRCSVFLPPQSSPVKNDFEENPETARTEAVDDGLDKGILYAAPAVGVTYLRPEQRIR